MVQKIDPQLDQDQKIDQQINPVRLAWMQSDFHGSSPVRFSWIHTYLQGYNVCMCTFVCIHVCVCVCVCVLDVCVPFVTLIPGSHTHPIL